MTDPISEERALPEVANVITRELLEKALKETKWSENVTVKDFSVKWATKVGDNMTTCVLRVKVTALHDGVREEHNLIVKTIPPTEQMRSFLFDDRLFNKEIGAYTKLFPALLKMQEGLGTKPVIPSVPKFYYGHEDAANVAGIVIIEDLRPKGFQMIEKRNGADLHHCRLVVKELATWHALTLALKNRDVEKMRHKFEFAFHEVQFGTSSEIWMKKILKDSVESMVSLIEKSALSSAELKKRSRKLLDFKEPFEEIKKAIQPEEPFALICHGDSWCNNMLFRYADCDGVQKPVAITLLDHQVVRYALPTTDLGYFLFLNTSRSLRKAHLQDLLELYHTTFVNTLRYVKFEFPEFTLDVVKSLFKKTAMLGILFGSMAIPFFQANREEFEIYDKLKSQDANEWLKKHEEMLNDAKRKQEEEGLSESDKRVIENFIGLVEDAMELGIL